MAALQDIIQGALEKHAAAEGRETIVMLDDHTATGFRVSAEHKEISQVLPPTCRWIPDFRLMRRTGAMYMSGIGLLVLLVGVMIGLKQDPTIGTSIGFIGVVLTPVLGMLGWSFATKYQAHDYKAFSIVRRVTLPRDEEPPFNALTMTEDVTGDDGESLRRYIVPYSHSFLNLASPTQEEMGDDYEPPPVARASILYQDSFQRSLAVLMAAKPDAWSRMKAFAPLGIIAAELIFIFLMMNVMMGNQ